MLCTCKHTFFVTVSVLERRGKLCSLVSQLRLDSSVSMFPHLQTALECSRALPQGARNLKKVSCESCALPPEVRSQPQTLMLTNVLNRQLCKTKVSKVPDAEIQHWGLSRFGSFIWQHHPWGHPPRSFSNSGTSRVSIFKGIPCWKRLWQNAPSSFSKNVLVKVFCAQTMLHRNLVVTQWPQSTRHNYVLSFEGSDTGE